MNFTFHNGRVAKDTENDQERYIKQIILDAGLTSSRELK